MRLKLVLLALVATSLACTANISQIKPTATLVPEAIPIATESTAVISVPPLEGLPIVIPPDISTIHMLDFQNGWMITDHFVLRTMDGGTTWHDVTPRGASTLGLGTGAAFLDSNLGWILIGDATDPVNRGTLYHTIDGGLNWTSNPVPFGGGMLNFLDAANGWMMLSAGVAAGSNGVRFYQTTDGGINWTQVYTNVPTDVGVSDTLPFGGMKSGFTSLSMQEAFVSGQTYASNDFYLYHTADGGRSWSKIEYLLPFTGEGMYLTQPPIFFDAQNGILPMTASSQETATFFLKTQDGGITWTIGAPVTGAGHYSVPSLNDVFIWFGGELSVSHDGGQTWTILKPNVDLSLNLLQLQFIDAQIGWAVTIDTNNGYTSLYKTTDGGQTWTAQVQ